jgi:hypothetical protein
MSLAGALALVFLGLFVRDLVEGFPALPLTILFVLLLVPVAACAWRPWTLLLLLALSFLASGVGLIWAQWDWRWDHDFFITETKGVEEAGWRVFGGAYGTRRQSMMYPLLSTFDDRDADAFEVRLSMREGGGPIDYEIAATAAVDGGPARPVDVEVEWPFRPGPVEVYVDETGERREVPYLSTSIHVPVSDLGQRTVLVLDLRLQRPTGVEQRTVTLTVEYQRNAELRVKTARL